MTVYLGDEFKELLAEQMRDPGFRLRWYLSTPKDWLILMWYKARGWLRKGS